jgi:two-component system, cell cycle response regulator DivK
MGPSQRSILVVEDDALSMRLLSDVLRAHGYYVLQAEDGITALLMTRKHQPDLILMDILLPGISGMEVVKWIREDDRLKTIPIIAVTASAMKGDKAKMLAGGCDDYLPKPVPLKQLVAMLERFLRP